MYNKEKIFLLVSSFAFIPVFCFASYLSLSLGSEYNIIIYILGLCICMLLSFLVAYFLYQKKVPQAIIPYGNIVSIIVLIVWMIYGFFYEMTTFTQVAVGYARHNIPCLVYFSILLLSTGILSYGIAKHMNTKNTKGIDVIFCLLALIVIAVISYQPAIFNDQFATIYHVHAYTNSIINVLHGAPFGENSFSIYGHYGIIYWIPVNFFRILGLSDLKATMAAIALIMTMQYAMFFYIARKRIKNTFIFYMVVIASMSPLLQLLKGGAYYQVWPHRTFPIITLLFALTLENKSSKRHIYNWLIVTGAIIWNTEIGIVCGGILVVYDILHKIVEIGKIWDKEIIKRTFYEILHLIVTFFAAMLTTNVYNLLAGGKWNGIRQFIYPIGNSTYNIAGLSVTLPNIFGWVWGIILIMLLYISVGLIRLIIHKSIEDETIFTLIVALSGLGAIVYYISRAADTNLPIIHFQLILLLALLIEKCWMSKTTNSKGIFNWNYEKIVGFIGTMILTVFIIGSITYLGIALQINIQYSNNTKEMDEFCEKLRVVGDENMIAFGEGVPELFAAMNRKTNLYICDWSDIDSATGNLVENTVTNQEYFFANVSNAQYLSCIWAFDLVETFELKGYSYNGYNTRNVNEHLYVFGIYKNRYWQQ